MTGETILVAVLAVALGALVGWLVASRRGHALAADLAAAQARGADADLVRQAKDAVERERNAAMQEAAGLRAAASARETALAAAATELDAAREESRAFAALRAETAARAEAHTAQLRQLTEARDALSAQFDQIAARALEGAQRQFLARADERFRQSEEQSGQSLKALLQPVNDRLQRYEEGVQKIEAERRDAFGSLHGQIEAMRAGTERVSGEAAKLVNALRNAPKARGRWGEQQLRNVLESCGLAEHTDFLMEVSIADGEGGGGRLRPDAVVTVPGGKSLIIDAKVSLNAYQDAFGAVDEAERTAHLVAHVQSIRTHVAGLSAKGYWSQFEDAPDYVIMFIPGEHFLSAALEQDAGLWDYAFDKRVLLATPTNLVAIARTVAAVWRQEKLATEARAIGALGKELYDRLAKASEDLRKVGSGLTSAVNNYNNFVSSFESRALVSARKFRDLNIEPGARELGTPEPVEVLARYGDEIPALPGATDEP